MLWSSPARGQMQTQLILHDFLGVSLVAGIPNVADTLEDPYRIHSAADILGLAARRMDRTHARVIGRERRVRRKRAATRWLAGGVEDARGGAGVARELGSSGPLPIQTGSRQGGGGSDCFFFLQFRGVSVKTLPSQLLTIWPHLSESDQTGQITQSVLFATT